MRHQFKRRLPLLGLSLFLIVALILLLATPSLADGPLPFSEDFNTFTGSGFQSSPSAGQLDSDIWIVTGMSDGSMSFGDTQTSGDFARGSSTGGVTTGGIYAFDSGSSDFMLGVQPGSSDFTPGDIVLRIQNTTGSTVSALDVSYLIWTYNDQARANSLNFSYSTDDSTYTPVAALNYTSPEAADSSPAWSSVSRNTTITGLSVAPNDYIYLKWTGDDVSGSGSRDEMGIDDVSVTVGSAPPNLTLSKSVSPDANLNAGDVVTYTIIIANSGSVSDTNVIMTDTGTLSTSYKASSVACQGGTGTCYDNAGSFPINWSGTISPSEVVTVTFVATHTGNYGETVTNTAEVSGTANAATAVATFTVIAATPDLSVAKTGPGGVLPGENIVYTITVENLGASTANNVILTDTLPVSAAYLADDSGYACSACSVGASGVLTFDLGSVAGSVVKTFNLTVTTDISLTTGSTLTNTVEITTSTAGDPSGNNSAFWTTSVLGKASELLLSEIRVTPTAGEMIEIYNPTANPINLSDVYLTDATFSGGGTYYYNIVTGSNAGGGSFGDFHARFPDGATINPGEYQTISLPGSNDFVTTYGISPTYELFEDGGSPDSIPDMREAFAGSINNQGGLSDSGEVVILYYWDGINDLVTDLDYIVWGDKVEAVDKTGVSIDGPDPDSAPSAYLNDTAISSQDVVDTGSHATAESWQRRDYTEGAEVKTGGNGAEGHNETSEDTSNTYCAAAPSPGVGHNCVPVLSLDKTANPNSDVLYHGLVTYTITIDNVGPADEAAALLTDTLPVSVTFSNWISQPVGAIQANNAITWTGGITTDQLITLSFVVSHTGDYNDVITNTAYISGSASADSASAGFTVQSDTPEITVSKTGPTVTYFGNTIVYNVTVQNTGGATATNVILTDTLPLSVTYLSDDASVAPANPISGVYVWSYGDLAAGFNETFKLTVTLDALTEAVITNTVDLTSSSPEDNPANNSDSWSTDVYSLTTIYDVQYVTNPISDDASTLLGQTVLLQGIVTAQPGEIDDPSRLFVIGDPAGGPWSGLPVYKGSAFSALNLSEGTEVQVTGVVTEYFGMTQIDAEFGDVQILGSGNPVPGPSVITTAMYDDSDPASSEQWEGVYLEFNDAVVTDDDLGFGEWQFDDGSGPARADDLGGDDNNLTYEPTLGDEYIFLRGIGWYSFGNYKLVPRYDADINVRAQTPEISKQAPTQVAPGELFTYTLTVSNSLGYTLTNVVITDVVPVSSTFAYALDGGVESGGVVSWTIAELAHQSAVSVRFAVTATNNTGVINNNAYAVVANNFITPTYGLPVGVFVGTGNMRIHHIQGGGHVSPLNGQSVSGIYGIVTAVDGHGFYIQDPNPDADIATSEGIFVYTGGAPTVSEGDEVTVDGTIVEFYSAGSEGLSVTQIELAGSPTISSTGNALPAPIVIGLGGRVPPTEVIAGPTNTGNVETNGVFNPTTDGIDFYESLEGMLVQVNNPIVVGSRDNGAIPIVPDGGSYATTMAGRSGITAGIVIDKGDFNPEKLIVDDGIVSSEPAARVGDSFTAPITGVIDYNDPDTTGNYILLNTRPLNLLPGGLTPETSVLTGSESELTVASYNVLNLDPTDSPAKFDALASQIVNNLNAPDIIALQEIQDNNGSADDGTTDASLTYQTLITAIINAGGPTYDWRDIPPEDNQDGGAPGGNIRVGYLFNPARVTLIERGNAGPTDTTVVQMGGNGVELSLSPGRVYPNDPAVAESRKSLAIEVEFNGQKVFIVNNHFNSKSGDAPIYSRFQPPDFASEAERQGIAQLTNNFVDEILALDPTANVIVLGDLNDFYYSAPISDTLAADILTNLVNTLPVSERYSYIFEGNSQMLDQILLSSALAGKAEFDIVHLNAEFDITSSSVRASDHDPVLTRLNLSQLPTPQPDLKISKSVSTASGGTANLPTGDVLTYTITLANNRTTSADSVVMTDTLPAGVSFGGFIAQGSAMLPGANTVTWGPYDIGAGISYTIIFTASIDAGTEGQTITNTAWFSSANAGMGMAWAAFTVITSTPPGNTPPVALNDAYTTTQGITLTVSAPGVLANDSDADSNPLTAVLNTGPVSGSLSLALDGGFVYTPTAGFYGVDGFTYYANDGQANSNLATVTITVTQVVSPPRPTIYLPLVLKNF